MLPCLVFAAAILARSTPWCAPTYAQPDGGGARPSPSIGFVAIGPLNGGAAAARTDAHPGGSDSERSRLDQLGDDGDADPPGRCRVRVER